MNSNQPVSPVPGLATARQRLSVPYAPALPSLAGADSARESDWIYGIHALDDRGRVVDAGVLAALQWQAGDRVSWSARTGSIVLRLSNVGTVRIGGAGRFWLPARARRHARIGAGDQVLLAARPVPGVLVVVAVSAVDEVVADAMSGVENGSAR